jgi:O-antigen/teichoic acid export membrane protein
LNQTIRRLAFWSKGKSISTLAKNTVWTFLGQGIRLLIQAVYFIAIARALGVQEYGEFIAVVSLVAIFAPFVGNGSTGLLVKNVSRERSLFREYWGNGLIVTLASGVVFSVLIIGVMRFALPRSIPLALTVAICLSDCVLLPLCDLSALAFQACEKLERFAQLNILVSASRFCGAIVMMTTISQPDAIRWSWFYVFSTLFSAAVSVTLTSYQLGFPKLALRRVPKEAKEGLHFALGQSARTIYDDIDKTMLARFSTLDDTGVYGAAYRIIDASFSPMRSLLSAAYPNFFRHGQDGLEASFAFARRLMARTIVLALLILLAIIVAAPVVPRILGADYERTAMALRWLAILPLFRTIHYLTAAALTGADFQKYRTYVQVAVAAFNILINFWLIPAYGWRGAAFSSLASDGLLAIAMYATYLSLRTRKMLPSGTPEIS